MYQSSQDRYGMSISFPLYFSHSFHCSHTPRKSLQSLHVMTGKMGMIDILEEPTERVMISMAIMVARRDLEEHRTHVGNQLVVQSVACYLVGKIHNYSTLSEFSILASREGGFLPAEYTQSRKSCANCSESQRSSGSALSQAQPQPTCMPIASSRTKHMTESARRAYRRSDSPRGSNEWDFLSSFPAVPGTLHKINLTTRSAPTPSKQWSVSHGARSGILKSPKLSDHSEPVMTSIRHRPSQASIFTADTGRTAVKQSKHTPNLSSSSSSSNDLQTPTSPSRNGLKAMPKVHHEHQSRDASDIDDEFALVSNGEEAIHWTKQTSDLRQLSPTRSGPSERENQSSSYPSLSSTSRSRLPLPTKKFVSSPSKPKSQSPASPTKSDSQQSKLDQRTRDRFGFSPSPTRVRPSNSVAPSHIRRGM